MVNRYKIPRTFQDIEHQFQENILLHFLHYSSLNSEVSMIHSQLFTGSFCNIALSYKLFKSQY